MVACRSPKPKMGVRLTPCLFGNVRESMGMHIVERSSRSVRILADWCNGSTSDSDSENIGSIPVLAVKNIRKKR